MASIQTELRVQQALAQLARHETRAQGVSALRAACQAATPVLVAVLEASDDVQAALAADALGLLGDPSGAAALARCALYGRPAVAPRAAAALGRLPISHAAVITLEECLASPNYAVRREAALALASLAAADAPVLAKRAESALAAMNAEDVTPICSAALVRLPHRACTMLFDVSISIDVQAAMEAVSRAAVHDGAAAKAHRVLARGVVAQRVAERLDLDNAAHMAPVLAMVCRALVSSLTRNEIAHENPLRGPVNRLSELLYQATHRGQREPLVAALREIGSDAQHVVAEGLADAPPDSTPRLAAALREAGWHPQPDEDGARFWIALNEWEECTAAGEAAIGPLVEVLLQNDLERRDGAAGALDCLGWQPDDEDLAVPLFVARRAWDELRTLGEPALSRLIGVLRIERTVAAARDSDAYRQDVRLGIVHTLAQIGGDEARDALEEQVFEDPSGPVRAAALRALQDLGELSSATLLQALDHEIRLARGAEGGPPRDGPRPSATMRRAALEALRAASLDEAIALVLDMALSDPDASCRAMAQAQLREAWQRRPAEVLAVSVSRSEKDGERGLADLLRDAGLPGPDVLAESLSSEDTETAWLASASLLALGRNGLDVEPALHRALLTGSPGGRRAAARILDAMGRPPADGNALAAYWLAHGQVERCLTLGREAIPVLRDALGAYEWPVAAQIACVLLQLGLNPGSRSLDEVERRLVAAAQRGDEQVTQVVRSEADGADRVVTLTVSHEEERQEARRLLRALVRLRAQA